MDSSKYPLNRCGIPVLSPPIKIAAPCSYVTTDGSGRPTVKHITSHFRQR